MRGGGSKGRGVLLFGGMFSGRGTKRQGCSLQRRGQMVGVLYFSLEVWMRLIYTFLPTGQGIFQQLP